MLSQQQIRSIAKPSEAQAEAGNYRMAKARVHGMDITIETPRGRRRNPAWPPLAAHYGYVRGTLGRDGDHVDVFVGPHPESELVVVVDQVDAAGKFDEHKALVGYRTTEDAIACYRKCYTPGWKVGPVTTMTIQQFKTWLADGTQDKPIAPQVSQYSAANPVPLETPPRQPANWDQRLAALWQRRDADNIERSLADRFAAAFESHVSRPQSTAERYAAIACEALVERYGARLKSSPGQLGLFGNGLGGNVLRSGKTQQRLDWDASKHPRETDGKFAEKGQGSTTTAPKKPRKPFVYPSGETQTIDADGKPASGPQEPPASKPEPPKPEPKEPTEEPKPKDPATSEPPAPAKAGELFDPEDASPRDVAAARQKQLDEDYAFARSSAIPNAGEDLKGSARHNRNLWSTLDAAERDGTAAELVNRAQLLQNEPHELGAHVESNPTAALMMHVALQHFPPNPGYGRNYGGAKERADYLDAYRTIKKAAEKIAADEKLADPRDIARKLATTVKAEIRRLRGIEGDSMMDAVRATDPQNMTANGLISLHNGLVDFRKKTGIVRKAGEFLIGLQGQASEQGTPLRDHVIDATHRLMAGESMSQVLGKKGQAKKKYFNPADAYVAHAEREGGKQIEAKTAKAASTYMVEKLGLRGVQWGNSVSDKEREHHAVKSAEALVDLADVCGLPLSAISLDGKLGLAIGARGRAGAAAHYEPGTQVINLTRKNGVGSLAHEWGHAMDHHVKGFASDGRGDPKYGSEDDNRKALEYNEPGNRQSGLKVGPDGKHVLIDKGTDPEWKSFDELRNSMSESGYDKRLKEQVRENVRSGAISSSGKMGPAYWLSGREKYARCFERFVQRKLDKAGRKNTYLAGLASKSWKEGGLWPTDAEVDHMAPHFEKVLDAYRKKHHNLEEPVRYSADERQAYVDRLTATLMGMTPEQYAARRVKDSPGQQSMFDEAKHPRAKDGEFSAQSNASAAGKPSQERPKAESAKSNAATPGKNTKAPWQMSRKEFKSSGIQHFQTSQGSNYLYANGQTIRAKTPHKGHNSKDVGLKQAGERVHFLDPQDAKKVGLWQTLQSSGKRIIEKDGHLLLTSMNPATGVRGVDERLPIASATPAEGLAPVELFGMQGNGWWTGNHPGNAITKLSPAGDEAYAIFSGAAKEKGHDTHPDASQPAEAAVPKSSGIQPPKAPKNSEAKAGDQLGMFGEATRAPRKQAQFGAPKAKQANLIDGLNAKRGQMSLIDEAGAPDDMVYKRREMFSSMLSDATIEQYRMGATPAIPTQSPKKSEGKQKIVTGKHGDRGRYVTTEDGVVIFITTDGTVNGGPKALKGTKVDLSKVTERKRKPKTQRSDKHVPKTRVEQAIVEAIGDHPDDVREFKPIVDDAHKYLSQEAADRQDAMRNLLVQFGIKNQQIGGWLGSLKRIRDYASIPKFDEMAEYARAHHPELLVAHGGESDKSGDDEASLFANLKQGFPAPPAKHSEEVIEKALEMAGPSFLEHMDSRDRATIATGGAVLANADDPFSDYVPFSMQPEDVFRCFYSALAALNA